MQGPRVESNSEPDAFYVDLDGTLVHGDTSAETLARYLLGNPLGLIQVLGWWRHGRARVKHELVARVDVDAANLPYNRPFMARVQQLLGRPERPELILASGAHERIVEAVANHCGYDAVLASDASVNRIGDAKLEAIRLRQAGRPFAYAGNAPVDMRVYAGAESCWVVNPVAGIDARLARAGRDFTLIDDRRGAPARWWASLGGPSLLLALVGAWAAWSGGAGVGMALALGFGLLMLVAAGNIARGFRDLDVDRRHPLRRETGIANAEVHPGLLLGVGGSLALAGTVLTFSLGVATGAVGLALGAATTLAGAHRRWPWWLSATLRPALALLAGGLLL